MEMEQLKEKAQSEQFLVFLLDKKNYGFPILEIDGIISIPKVTPLPKAPPFVKGVINIREQIVPIIDLRLTFNMTQIEYNEQTCIVLIKVPIKNTEKLVGFVVDTVSEVFDIPISEIEEGANCGVEIDGEFLRGLGKAKNKIIILLNIAKIINTSSTICVLNRNLEYLNELSK